MQFRGNLLAAAGQLWGVALVFLLVGGCADTSPPPSQADGSSGETTNSTAAETDVVSTAPTNDPFAQPTTDSPNPATPDQTPLAKPLVTKPPIGSESGGHENWISDFAAAKTQAQAEGKDILMDFTGSDWCGWCIRLSDEVFRHAEFKEYAENNFVLLELDFPNDKSRLSEETIAQNEELKTRFPIPGFPTIVLADALGRPYAQTGYQQGGPQSYVEHLEGLKTARASRDAAFEAAGQLTGAEKAKKLAEGLGAIPAAYVLPSYETEVAAIISADEDNEAGLREEYETRLVASRFQQAFGEVMQFAQTTKDVEASFQKLDELENGGEFTDFAEGRLSMNLMRLQLLQISNRTDELVALADKVLADTQIPAEGRFKLYLAKLGGLRQANRLPEAIGVTDSFLKEFSEDSSLVANLQLTKADFLVKLNRKDEAAAVVQEARKVADEQLLPTIEQFEKQFLQSDTAAPAASGQPEN